MTGASDPLDRLRPSAPPPGLRARVLAAARARAAEQRAPASGRFDPDRLFGLVLLLTLLAHLAVELLAGVRPSFVLPLDRPSFDPWATEAPVVTQPPTPAEVRR
ncbi:MAG: hypothetical protein IPJ17_06095 [Holophagales bacterium]|nr:MAG: hypothetical protein IPJ17_06095 [Holophagales bacterium]